MNSSQALKAALSTLGYPVYQDRVTIDLEGTSPSYLIYQRISSGDILSHAGRSGLVKSRYQITHVADDPANRETMVEAVRTLLLGNTTNFRCAVGTDIHIEDKEADKTYTAKKDYFIWMTE